MTKKDEIYIDFIQPDSKGGLIIEGYVDSNQKRPAVQLKTNSTTHDIMYTTRNQSMRTRAGEDVRSDNAFSVTTAIHENDCIIFMQNAVPLRIHTNEFTRLASFTFAYTQRDERLLRKYRTSILIRPKTLARGFAYEVCLALRLLGYWRLEKVSLLLNQSRGGSLKSKLVMIVKSVGIVAETLWHLPRDYVLRCIALKRRSAKSREIWIISDRGMAAGDNGEALFRYTMNLTSRLTDVYFAISKKSKDYERMQKIGPVLDQGSLRYKLYFLLADKIISSHADVEVTNPFLRQQNHAVDLYKFDFIFLQHGITKDNVSSWLNRFDKNIKLFVTAGKPEYESILDYPYYYPKENVLLSGFPRYDLLESKPKQKVIIAPTYRADLLKTNTDATGARQYDKTFKKSKYFSFYNELMNDARIINALQENNMTAELYLHPNFAAQIGDFTTNDVASVAQYPYDYKTAISEGSLLVTDYSSVAFDFAYLKKPIVYAQFDREDFFAHHVYTEGYFSYEDDGFGPVCRDYEATVQAVLRAIGDNATQASEYVVRIDNFFAFTDKENSKRVYDAIEMVQ